MRRIPRPRTVLAWADVAPLLLPEANPFGLSRRSGPSAAFRGLFGGLGFALEELSVLSIEPG